MNSLPAPRPDVRLFSTWGPTTDKPTYQTLSKKVVHFLYPPDVIMQSRGLNLQFSPHNVQLFLQQFSHYQAHFSLLHIPTFEIDKAYTGLLAAMCCVGACYSDSVPASHVREFAHFLKAAFERDRQMLSLVYDRSHTTSSVEELQSLILLHVLLTWNGHPSQRHASHEVFSHIAIIARKIDLLHVSNDAKLSSPLHQPDFAAATFSPFQFDWMTFIRQEQRIRVMSMIWLMDVAGGLYFNLPATFDYRELHIPLPCDDAAFDATDGSSCAEALGLYGHAAARMRNPDGTQRPSQPWLVNAVNALLHSSYAMQTGSTNLTGKFIIIHTLLSLMRRAQVEGSLSISSSPMSQHAWVVGTARNGAGDACHSGRSTPMDGDLPTPALRAMHTALGKFKSSWDEDYVAQFSTATYLPRRYGFSKDAVPFYWLAQHMLKNTRASDLALPAEQRFMQVISLLKSVKSWVKTDGASRGEEMGSVGDIDNNFGLSDLSLDMAKIFRPMPWVVETTATVKLSTDTYDERVKREAT